MRGGHTRPRPWLEWAVGALILALLIVAIRDRQMGLDEGIWNYVAREWVVEGIPPYQGPVENKPPGIYYLFTVSYLLLGQGYLAPRLAGVAALLACCATLYALGRRLGDRTTGLVAALVCGLVVPSRAVDGPEATMTASFTMAFTTLALFLVVTGTPRAVGAGRRRRVLGAGALLGLAVAFKQIALVAGPVLALWVWSFTPREHRAVGRWARDVTLLSVGAGLATVATLVPLWMAGVSWSEYWAGAWLLLLDRGSRAATMAVRIERFRHTFHHPLTTLAVLVAAFVALRPRLVRAGAPWGAVVGWFVLEAAGAAASGNFYPHHFKPIVPPAALATAFLVRLATEEARARGLDRRLVPAAVGVLALALLPTLALGAMLGGQQPLRWYTPDADVGELVRDRTRPGDEVYTWTWAGLVQAVSLRRSPSRFFNRNFVTTDAAALTVLRDLRRRPPRMLVVDRDAPCWLVRYVEACCRRVEGPWEWLDVFEAVGPPPGAPEPRDAGTTCPLWTDPRGLP